MLTGLPAIGGVGTGEKIGVAFLDQNLEADVLARLAKRRHALQMRAGMFEAVIFGKQGFVNATDTDAPAMMLYIQIHAVVKLLKTLLALQDVNTIRPPSHPIIIKKFNSLALQDSAHRVYSRFAWRHGVGFPIRERF